MSERAEGRMDWEIGKTEAVGAVPKFIAEVRAAVGDGKSKSQDVDAAAQAFQCIVDALAAFDAAVKAEKEATNG